MAEDRFKLADNVVFGSFKKTDVPDDHVDDLWANTGDDECSSVRRAVQEARSKVRKQQTSYPHFMKDPAYRHGVTTSKADEDAKKLIYTDYDDTKDTNENAENNYITSHGSYKPGQQKRRAYNWPVNPESTVFGVKGESNITNRGSSAGVAEALQIPEDTIVATACKVDPDQVFGKSTSSPNSSAADCLVHTNNTNTCKDTNEDDIGKSLTPGFRNAETKRCFGCPSVRTDIPKYERASVADTQNYGDDVNAGYLLRPSLLSSFGLEEDAFHKPRSKGYIRRLFQSCGLTIDDRLFEYTFGRVADENDLASIDAFRNAYEMPKTK